MKMKTVEVEKLGSGKRVECEVHYELDVEAFRGCPGFALLLLAANPHVPAPDLQEILAGEDVDRPIRWLQKRRWLFRQPGTSGKANRDGRDDEARGIMHANTGMSAAKLAKLLAEHGIRRCEEWVRRHRCDSPTSPHAP